MSVRLAWFIAVVCCLSVVAELHYINELLKDAPATQCSDFINSEDCEKAKEQNNVDSH